MCEFLQSYKLIIFTTVIFTTPTTKFVGAEMEIQKTRFFELLSQQINLGPDKFDFQSLSAYLNEAVNVLPDAKFKVALLQQPHENSTRLWSLIKASKKQSDETLFFNTFTEEGRQETLKNILTLKSYKEQLHYLTQVAFSHPSKDLFHLLLDAEAQITKESRLEVLVKVTELCCHLTIGCNNLKVLHDLMDFFLSEIVKIFEEFGTSDSPEGSWVKMKDAMCGLLVHCQLKCQIHKTKDVDLTQFRDLFAAILSLYVDVVTQTGDRDDSTLNHVSNLVYLLLDDSPSHLLDTVNQISTLDKSSVEFLLPFLRKVLSSTGTTCTEFTNYLKYICATKRVLKYLYNQNDIRSIEKIVAFAVLPKDGFLSWMSDQDESLLDDLKLPGVSRNKITQHLLQLDFDDDLIERILDLVAGEKKSSEKASTNDIKETSQEEKDSDVLFFVDSQGSSQLLDQCEEEEFSNSKNDKMLKKQIDAMLERLKPDSDDENDEDDLNFDGEMNFSKDLVESVTTASPEHENSKPKDSPELKDMSKEIPIVISEPIIKLEFTQTPGRNDEKRKRKRESGLRRKSTGSIVQTVKKTSAKRKTRNTTN